MPGFHFIPSGLLPLSRVGKPLFGLPTRVTESNTYSSCFYHVAFCVGTDNVPTLLAFPDSATLHPGYIFQQLLPLAQQKYTVFGLAT